MSSFAHFLSLYISGLSIPCLAIIGILFHVKQRSKESFVFASGLILLAIGGISSNLFTFRNSYYE